jgi:tRNA(Ile)-lysidine synthase
MTPVSGRIIRPLIDTDRAGVEDYLQSRNQSWQTDATNQDLGFARNRMRHVILPELVRGFNPQIFSTLSRNLEVLQEEDQWMRGTAETWLDAHSEAVETVLALDAEALAGEPVALIRRTIRAALRRAGSSLNDVTFDHIEQIRSLLGRGKSGRRIEIPGNVTVWREFDRLAFRSSSAMAAEFSYELQIPGSVHVSELRQTFRAEIVDAEKIVTEDGRVFVDGTKIGPYVKIRNWKPGDFYKPVGLPAGKLKKLFHRARIPRSQRSRWPVVINDSTIVWVASFPVSREFAPCGRSQKVVALEALPE